MSEPRECECRQPDCFRCELAGTREWLAAHGLYVVTAADKAVLDAMAATVESALRRTIRLRTGQTQAAAKAELARREAAK